MDIGDHATPIAIIGMGCRFSGDATSPEKLWDMLANGENGWTKIPKSRFNVEGLYHPDDQRVATVRWSSVPKMIQGIRSHVCTLLIETDSR